jgi:hypothetical protein
MAIFLQLTSIFVILEALFGESFKRAFAPIKKPTITIVMLGVGIYIFYMSVR